MSTTEDDSLVPDIQFDAIMSADEASDILRDGFDGRVKGITQTVLLATMSRSAMVGAFRTLGEEEIKHTVDCAIAFAGWAEAMSETANAVARRSLVAAAEIAGALTPFVGEIAAEPIP